MSSQWQADGPGRKVRNAPSIPHFLQIAERRGEAFYVGVVYAGLTLASGEYPTAEGALDALAKMTDCDCLSLGCLVCVTRQACRQNDNHLYRKGLAYYEMVRCSPRKEG